MRANRMSSYSLRLLLLVLTWVIFSPHTLLAEYKNQTDDCMENAIQRIIEIRSLPKKQYLHTLDGQEIMLHEFHFKCLKLHPQCNLFEKFYYLSNEIREVASKTEKGTIKHKIRSYSDCLSEFCPDRYNPQKIYGDVAEFYDDNGDFMGLTVYMGDGKYCPLPYDGYQKYD